MSLSALPQRWLAAARGSLRLMSPSWVAGGVVASIGLAALLGARAGTADESARAIRGAWLAWLVGLTGLGEDHGEARRLVVAMPLWERFALRLALAAVGSLLVGVAVVAIVEATATPGAGLARLVAEAAAAYLVLAGWAGVAWLVSPPGRAGAITLLLLLGSLASDLVVPASWRLWPSTGAAAYGRPPVAWCVAGAALLALVVVAMVRRDRRGAAR